MGLPWLLLEAVSSEYGIEARRQTICQRIGGREHSAAFTGHRAASPDRARITRIRRRISQELTRVTIIPHCPEAPAREVCPPGAIAKWPARISWKSRQKHVGWIEPSTPRRT